MKTLQAIILSLFLSVGSVSDLPKAEIFYYGAESKGILCGYSAVHMEYIEQNGRKLLRIQEEGETKLTALGAPFHTKFKFLFHIDPTTGQYVYFTSDYSQQENKISMVIEVNTNQAHISWEPQGKKTTITLPPDCILPNYQYFPHLLKVFNKNQETKKTFKVLDLRDAEVHELVYTKMAPEVLELNSKTVSALVLEERNLYTGQKAKLWLDPENGYRLKTELPNRTIFLAEKSVRNRIVAVSMDDKMVAKVNVIIPDVRHTSYMKVKAVLEPRGLLATSESLNVPGQNFKGTVKENHISGTFEIQHKRYNGENTPPFPPDFSQDTSLKEYLQPGPDRSRRSGPDK